MESLLVLLILPLAVGVILLIVEYWIIQLRRKSGKDSAHTPSPDIEMQDTDMHSMARSCLHISVSETIKDEMKHPGQPLDIWAAKFVIANRSNEPVYVLKIEVRLSFYLFPCPTSTADRLLKYIFGHSPDRRFVCGFRLYEGEATFSSTLPRSVLEIDVEDTGWLGETHYACLVNWETREPIYLFEHGEHRGPAPGNKEVWMLLGVFPPKIGYRLAKARLYLSEIGCRFYTDQGKIFVSSSYPVMQTISDTLRNDLQEVVHASHYRS
jgi:hypothetical protein